MMRFAPMARLEIRHDFFGDATPPIELIPDAETTRLASRSDLRVRYSDSLVEIFASDDRAALAMIAADGGGVLNFTLRLRPRDPTLVAMTDVVAQATDQIAVLDAKAGDLAGLQSANKVGADEMRALAPNDIVTEADLMRPPFAIVRLQVAPDQRDGRLQVRFATVQRFWLYHLMGGDEDASYAIKDRKDELSFASVGPSLMANGKTAQSFKSSTPIAELARPENRFDLVTDGPFGQRVVIPSLPSPRPGLGQLEATDTTTSAVSEIFVNLW